ncbi:hypothetical protein [Halostagnicola bangensis]
MVNLRAVKLAIVVFGFLLVALIAGQVLRRLTWMLTWGLTMAILLAMAYGAYEIWSGWTAGGEDEHPHRTRESTTSKSTATSTFDSVDDAKAAYTDDALSDEEFESELEDIMDADSRELERDYN